MYNGFLIDQGFFNGLVGVGYWRILEMRRLVSLFLVMFCVTVVGCDRKDGGDGSSEAKELLLYCGAGISPPVDEVVNAFFSGYGVKVVPDYAGSEVLLSKIKLSERGDLYMPGDRYYVGQAEEAGLILSRSSVSYWVPTILVQKGNPKNISGLEDLLKPGVRVGLGDPKACAIGRTTWQILARSGITRQDLDENLLYQSLTVNELGMQIQARSLDAVIVWDAMAVYFSQYGDQAPIPLEDNIVSTVDVGVLKFTKNRALAENFVAFLTSEEGRAIFAKHKYRTEAPR